MRNNLLISLYLALVACLAIGGVARPVLAQERPVPVPGGASRNDLVPLINPDAGLPAKAQPRTSLSGNQPASSDGVLIENSQLKIKNGFGAQFWVVDSEEFFLNWLRSDMRNLVPVTLARRGVPLYLAVFLLDPGIQNGIRKHCDVTYDYEVLKPDGGCVGAGKNCTAWASARPPPPHIVQLAVSNIPDAGEQTGGQSMPRYPRVLLGVIDPPGEYVINVIVHDNIKKIDIPLQRTLVLQE